MMNKLVSVNNYAMTKKFLITKFDCTKLELIECGSSGEDVVHSEELMGNIGHDLQSEA